MITVLLIEEPPRRVRILRAVGRTVAVSLVCAALGGGVASALIAGTCMLRLAMTGHPLWMLGYSLHAAASTLVLLTVGRAALSSARALLTNASSRGYSGTPV